ncbi:redoxin domain-containing protein [uncultured Bacteroides sp.]|uniref:peroxiredoxin n=1 Tax=uncultured Bacteroides sp. TaxID=162156 RepID=UPI002AA6CAD3|nr:redoxin domain-containing protein [uncultured Bacteroides sp.]
MMEKVIVLQRNTDQGIWKSEAGRMFSLFSLIVSLLILFSLPAYSRAPEKGMTDAVKVGSTVPSFSLKDQNGKTFVLDSVLGKQNLVIYFYPKDDTPGCTKEACSFRDQFEVFKDKNTMIIGISGQSVQSHLDFAHKYQLNFTLLSDEDNSVRKLFGVPSSAMGTIPGRVTYIVDKKGKVVFMFNSLVNAEKHVEEALRVIKTLK